MTVAILLLRSLVGFSLGCRAVACLSLWVPLLRCTVTAGGVRRVSVVVAVVALRGCCGRDTVALFVWVRVRLIEVVALLE